MGAVEDAVDAAANFIGPFVDKDRKNSPSAIHTDQLVDQALKHLQAINSADLATDPDAPYDASLAGVVYGLLDLIALLGILPHLSPGVAFSQRPRSVLTALITVPSSRNEDLLSRVAQTLIPILEQPGSGVQPLLSQRVLPDIFSALAELSFSLESSQDIRSRFDCIYRNVVAEVPTSRLLPILATFLQQSLPTWLKPVISRELALVPLRQQGVRHTIEFLSLSYLSKNSQVPEDASGPQSQIPIPLEAVTQTSRLLVLPPTGISQDDWLRRLGPQLLRLLDGRDGRELSRAAGQIIAGGILSKKTTGAPGTVGWELFALPLLQLIYPKDVRKRTPKKNTADQVIVQEQDLCLALKRLSTITSSYSHAGLLRRLVGPLLLPLWALLNHAKTRPSLDKEWVRLPRDILTRYMTIACNTTQVDSIASNLFWDGDASWTFGPGSQGGIEIRWRAQDDHGLEEMDGILLRIGNLDSRVNLFVSLLADAKIPDDVAGSIFLQATKRWLSSGQHLETSLTGELETDPLATLADAKMSEALATNFKDQFSESPQHIIELMGQLIQNYVNEHQLRVERLSKSHLPSRISLGNIVKERTQTAVGRESDKEHTVDEDLVSFALSVITTLAESPGFKKTPATTTVLHPIVPSLVYLSQQRDQLPIPSLVTNSASNLLDIFTPSASTKSTSATKIDPLSDHRSTLKSILSDLTSSEPPNRTWALNALQKLIQNPVTFPVIDLPSTTHMLLSVSLADPESYVHTAAIPVLVKIANYAPHPVIRILTDAFIDIEEQSLKLARGRQTEEKERQLQNALDFRLRIGQVLNDIILDHRFNDSHNDIALRYRCLKQIIEACLSLASRRGQRTKALSMRTQLAEAEQKLQEEGEAAWGGPIPNFLEPENENPNDKAERDALAKIVQGWQDTGIEEDVRIRTSALSILCTVLEDQLRLLSQPTIDAVLQSVLLILSMETLEDKAILRRAAVLVIMGLLRGLDAALENGEDIPVRLSMKQQNEVERVVKWIRDSDVDALVRDHATSVAEGLETLRLKELYKVRDEGLRLGPDLGLEGALRGLDVRPDVEGKAGKRKLVVEEIE
ncbi:Nn.00g015820.m01.CDS01 [Neocucurbitaria sp. VM-36]